VKQERSLYRYPMRLCILPLSFVFVTASVLLSACASNAAPPLEVNKSETMEAEKVYPRDDHGEVLAFESISETDASFVVKRAISEAKMTGKQALIVMGTNRCHDSRALATYFEEPDFKTLLRAHYILEYIDVGWKTDNLHIANGFGLDGIKGTPTVVIVNGEGDVQNLDEAPTWRNAASRNKDDVFEYFRGYAHKN